MKIIGSGLIGSRFSDSHYSSSNLIFASGVSASSCKSKMEFKRERDLLAYWLNKRPDIIYFSTCSIEDPNLSDNEYVLHKQEMESLVLSHPKGIVIRVPQIVGRSNNKNTLINFLFDKIYNQDEFDLYIGAVRNLIDIDDVVKLTNLLIDSQKNISQCSFAMPFDYEITKIVSCIETILNKKAIFKPKKIKPFSYPRSQFISDAVSLGLINFEENYLEKVLFKHYSDYYA